MTTVPLSPAIPYRVVNHNQDTLLVNFKFANEDGTLNGATLPQHVADQLDAWQALARKDHTPVPTDLTFAYLIGTERSEQTLMIRPHGSGVWSWLLFCDDLSLSMAYGSINGVYARVRFSSHLLHTVGAEYALLRIEGMFQSLLQGHFHKQVSEIHLCADIVGWDLTSIDWQHDFVSRVVLIRERPELPEENEQEGGLSSGEIKQLEETIKEQSKEGTHAPFPTTEHRKIATLDFGTHGSEISGQIYNKSREIKKHKKQWFVPIWKANGYNPATDGEVVRVEFRIKRKWLASVELNDPADIFARLEQLWRYCTEEWLRYVDSSADTANISRRPTHEVWTVIQNAYTVPANQVTRDLQGEQQARIEHLIARNPLGVLQDASNLHLEDQLRSEPVLPAEALKPIRIICRKYLHPSFSCVFLHWFSLDYEKQIYDRLRQNRAAMEQTAHELPEEVVIALAHQAVEALSPDLLTFWLSLCSPASFRQVITPLVKRSRRMAKKEVCIPAIAGYLRSAIALAGGEVAQQPDLLASLLWLCEEIKRYDESKGRVHLYEVLKKQLGYGFITAQQLLDEMAQHGVELQKTDWQAIEKNLAALRETTEYHQPPTEDNDDELKSA